jgi:hypothetical protein
MARTSKKLTHGQTDAQTVDDGRIKMVCVYSAKNVYY